MKFTKQKVAAPSNLSVPKNKVQEIVKGNYYVSVNGSDNNSGTSPENAFATLQKAQMEVRERIARGDVPDGGLTVAVMAGNYTVNHFMLDGNDSGSAGKPITYAAYGNGETVINGGVWLKAEDFTAVSGDVAVRLSKEASQHIKMLDLSKYNLTKEDYGSLCAIGGFNTGEYYDDNPTGINQCELFCNDERLILARYPNQGYLKTGKVLDIGDAYEVSPPGPKDESWKERRNQRGGTFQLDEKAYQRVRNWKSLDDVWAFGYFFWDWADMSTPIASINDKDKTLTTRYCSQFGFRENCDYYFYNVLEELDMPGEYYIDRNKNILYLYPSKEFSSGKIILSVTTKSIVEISENASYINIKGMTIQGTRGDAIVVSGKNCSVESCLVKNVSGSGIHVSGRRNIIKSCEVRNVGRDAVVLSGGDRNDLTPGENVVENCYLHDFGQIQKTYISGVKIDGVGNRAAHNEICSAPHMGIFFTGNENVIEYNNIHDVVLYSSDAGAIYTGADFSTYGNIVRYNCIYNIGSGEFTPNGIYFDDNSSGQTAYGNILVNIPHNAFLIGGGRDHTIQNNLVIHADTAICYDDRAYEGYHHDGWYAMACKEPDSRLWFLLKEAKALNQKWGGKYEGIDRMHQDYAREDEEGFAVNPAGSIVSNNILITEKGEIGEIADTVQKYSQVINNGCYTLDSCKNQWNDAKNGIYSFHPEAEILKQNPNFKEIPFEKIGRY